jgi:hypothetical protein
MFRTLPFASFLAAALLLTNGSLAGAQDHGIDAAPVPSHLLARAAAPGTSAAGVDAAPATIQPATIQLPQPRPRLDPVIAERRPAALPALYASMVALQGLDIYTTQKGMALGARETNPLVRNGNTATFVALKAGSTAATMLVAERMWKKNRAGAIAFMAATNLVYGAVVAHNARVIGEVR